MTGETTAAEGGGAASIDGRGSDVLLESLLYVAAELGLPGNRQAALAGLPLRGGSLSLDLAARAAERLGLKLAIVERTPSRVPALVCPFIVLLKSGDAVVVKAFDRRRRRALVVDPLAGGTHRTVRVSQLERDSTGHVLYVSRADQQAAGDADAVRVTLKGRWLLNAAMKFWPAWLQIVIASLLLNMLALALPLFVMNVYDRVIPNLAFPTLWALAGGVVLALLFDFVLKLLRTRLLDNTGRRVDMRIAAGLFEHALAIPLAGRTLSTGAVASLVRDFEHVRDFFTSTSIVAAIDLLFIGIFIGVLWIIVGPLAYVPLVAVPLVVLVTLLAQVPLSRAMRRTQDASSRRHSVLIEGLSGIETVKAVGAEGTLQREWEAAVAASARANSASRFWSSFAMYFTATAYQAVSVIIIVWGVFLVADGQISVGSLIAANILAGRALAPLTGIAQTLSRAQQAFTALHGLNRFVELEREQAGVKTSTQPSEGSVSFASVSFRYPAASEDALHDVSFSIGAGERVAIMGRVGSGKSTLGRLCAGLYEPQSGTILIDGLEARAYDAASLRTGVAYVSQDADLFEGTLQQNIIIGKRHAGEAEVLEAARLAGVMGFAGRHPLGLAMPVGERGRFLSGGQARAVAIARALIRKPKLLFLDEPSNAMDTATEAELIANLQEVAASGVTLVIATHRGSLLKLVDRVLVFEQGKLVADGPRDTVLRQLQQQALRVAGARPGELKAGE